MPFESMASNFIKRDYEYIKKWDDNISTNLWVNYLAESELTRYTLSNIVAHIKNLKNLESISSKVFHSDT